MEKERTGVGTKKGKDRQYLYSDDIIVGDLIGEDGVGDDDSTSAASSVDKCLF